MTLKTKPRNTTVPFILDIYDADLPEGSPRVMGRCDTRDGTVWKTDGSTVSLKTLRAAVRKHS